MTREKIFEGAIVNIQGHEFKVTNLRFIMINDKKTARFEGVCTDSDRNKSIINTGYNGATYGGNDFIYDWSEVIKLKGKPGPTAPLTDREI